MLIHILDVIRCTACSHENIVTHAWLDRVGQRQRRRDDGLLWIGDLTHRLKCSKCSSREFEIKSLNPTNAIKSRELCTTCNGTGGPHWRCWKCYGSGLSN